MVKAALAVLLLAAPASGAPGSTGADFLNFGQGPRAIAMGESNVAVADDAYAAYWNPAGLATLKHPSVATTYNKALEGIDQQYISLAYPIRSGTALDLNVTRLGMSTFQGYDAQGTKTRSLGASDYAVGGAIAQTVARDSEGRPLLNAGVNVKAIQEQLDNTKARTVAADLGLLFFLRSSEATLGRPRDQGWRFGLAARNLGPGLKFDRDPAPLPMTASAGMAYRAYPRNDSLTASFDWVYRRSEDPYAALGLEYTAFRVLALRVGYKVGQDIGIGLRAGVGFKLKAIEVDYAYAGFGELGSMHRIGFTARLGGPVELTAPEESLLKERIEKGKRLMKEGRNYEAVLEFDEVLQQDAGNREALDLMRQANEKLKK